MKVLSGWTRKANRSASLVTTPANAHGSARIGELLHGEEKEIRGDSAYMGKTEELREKTPHTVDHAQGTSEERLFVFL